MNSRRRTPTDVRPHRLGMRPCAARTGTACLIASVAACGTADSGSRATVSDSAGVTIVSSAAPAWDEASAWRIAPEPDLAIGEPPLTPASEFSRIRRVYTLEDGTIVVANSSRPVDIRLFDETGAHSRTIGREGAGPGELRAIWDLWIARPDTIVVFDPGLSRMTRFDPLGRALEMVTFEQRSDRVAWLPWARFSDGTFLMRRNVFIENVDGGSGRSLAPSVRGMATGEIVDTIGVFPETDYYTLPSGNPGFVRFGRRAVLYVSGNRYYRGMGDTFTIDEYDASGRHLRSLRRAHEPRPITDDVKVRLMENEIEAVPPEREQAIRETWAERPVAETFPAFGELWIADSAGNLWIQNFATPVDPQPPFSVFDAAGRWLGDVAFPDGFTPHEIGDDYVIGVFRDTLDVETVRRYSLLEGQ
jgi:hypothetical protein